MVHQREPLQDSPRHNFSEVLWDSNLFLGLYLCHPSIFCVSSYIESWGRPSRCGKDSLSLSPCISSLPQKYREKRLCMRNYDERMTRQSRDEALTLVRPAAVESLLKIKWTKFSGFRISLTKPVRIQRGKLGRRENIKRRRNKHTHSAPAIHTHPRNFITCVTENVGPIYFFFLSFFFVIFF